MAPEESSQPKGKLVRLVWSEAGPPIVANQAIVQYDGSLVYITFGQASPPIILGDTEDERRQQLEKIESVSVLPVIRIAMAPANFRSVAAALQKHLTTMDKFEKPEQEQERK